MVDDAIEKVERGITTLEELIRVVPYRQLIQARDIPVLVPVTDAE